MKLLKFIQMYSHFQNNLHLPKEVRITEDEKKDYFVILKDINRIEVFPYEEPKAVYVGV